jgi:hypothetical protein
LLEWDGLRFLTDPTFDAGGGAYQTGPVTLHKLTSPAISAESVGRLDAVLLSQDHHFDNLDHAGRNLLGKVERVFTTPEGAARSEAMHQALAIGRQRALRRRRETLCSSQALPDGTDRREAIEDLSRASRWHGSSSPMPPCMSRETRSGMKASRK